MKERLPSKLPHEINKKQDRQNKEGAAHLEAGRDIFTPFINTYAEHVAQSQETSEQLSIPSPSLSPNVDAFISQENVIHGHTGDWMGYPSPSLPMTFDSEEEIAAMFINIPERNRHIYIEDALIEAQTYKRIISESEIGKILQDRPLQEKKNYIRMLNSIRHNSRYFTRFFLNNTDPQHEHKQAYHAGLLPLASHSHFLWGVDMDTESVDSTFNTTIIPIGPYGKGLAEKLYNTTQTMLYHTQHTESLGADLAKRHTAFLQKTARGGEVSPSSKKFDRVPHKILREGIHSLTSAIVLASSEKIDGYDDYDKLIHTIVKEGIPTKMAHSIPGGVINPLVNISKYIPELIQTDGDQLKLNSQICNNIFTPWKNNAKHGNEYKNDRAQIPAAGRGCPVAFKGKSFKESGIDCLSATFLSIYDQQ